MIQAVLNRPATNQYRLVTEVVPCGVCRQQLPRRLFTERYELAGQAVELGINRCTGCGQVYVSPRLDRRSSAYVYAADAQRTISHQYCWSEQSSDQRFRPLLDRLAARVPAGRVLDVGCGSGSLLRVAERYGRWQLSGVEPSEQAAELARTRTRAEIHTATLETAPLPRGHFDVVTLLGVLEHLPDPLSTLQHARHLLRANGLLAVYVPNFNYLRCKDTGLASVVRGRGWSCLAPQEHLFHFTPGTLGQLLRRAGFEPVCSDVGRPFLRGPAWRRSLKRLAFAATVGLRFTTGVHLGGLEVLARPQAGAQGEEKTEP